MAVKSTASAPKYSLVSCANSMDTPKEIEIKLVYMALEKKF